ncbi:MAG: DUF554 domain-containing protein [Treponema sp.]|nr:DUF554 domain-containing protein [Treponema sp.]
MLGPIVNAAAIIVCSLIGCYLLKRIPERFEDIIKKASGLAVIFVGIKGALVNENIVLLIMSMLTGAVLGEIINIDKWMKKFGLWAERKLKIDKSGQSFSKGFVASTILFCTGSMAIVGSIQSGLAGNHEILFAKSALDGFMSLVFSAAMGIGVAFSAVCVFVYQGAIVLASQFVSAYLTDDIVREMSAAGSLIIAGIGFNFLEIKEIKVANLIPAVFIPLIWMSLPAFF